MRAVVQRVSSASVTVAGRTRASIGAGLLAYVGVALEDTPDDARSLADKMARLRMFPDDEGRMNLDVSQTGGSILVVSAFTLMADARRGRRPSLEQARRGDAARDLYESACLRLADLGVPVARGVFGAMMDVESVNAGPVCILIDSRRAF